MLVYTDANSCQESLSSCAANHLGDILLICDKSVATVSQQQCRNSKFVIFQEKLLKVLKCYNFLWVQWWHNFSPVESFANCVMTLYLLKVLLQTFLSTLITQKCQILSCDTLVTNEWYHNSVFISCYGIFLRFCLLYIIVYWCWWHIGSNVINSIHMRQTFGNFNKNEHLYLLQF